MAHAILMGDAPGKSNISAGCAFVCRLTECSIANTTHTETEHYHHHRHRSRLLLLLSFSEWLLLFVAKGHKHTLKCFKLQNHRT